MSDAQVAAVVGDESSRLVLKGAMSLAEVSTVLTAARQLASETAPVSVELGEVAHLHAACVQVLLALRLKVEGQQRSFAIGSLSDGARRALTLAGLEQWVKESEG
jgi:ABC-type transporter Mla MlaB component